MRTAHKYPILAPMLMAAFTMSFGVFAKDYSENATNLQHAKKETKLELSGEAKRRELNSIIKKLSEEKKENSFSQGSLLDLITDYSRKFDPSAKGQILLVQNGNFEGTTSLSRGIFTDKTVIVKENPQAEENFEPTQETAEVEKLFSGLNQTPKTENSDASEAECVDCQQENPLAQNQEIAEQIKEIAPAPEKVPLNDELVALTGKVQEEPLPKSTKGLSLEEIENLILIRHEFAKAVEATDTETLSKDDQELLLQTEKLASEQVKVLKGYRLALEQNPRSTEENPIAPKEIAEVTPVPEPVDLVSTVSVQNSENLGLVAKTISAVPVPVPAPVTAPERSLQNVINQDGVPLVLVQPPVEIGTTTTTAVPTSSAPINNPTAPPVGPVEISEAPVAVAQAETTEEEPASDVAEETVDEEPEVELAETSDEKEETNEEILASIEAKYSEMYKLKEIELRASYQLGLEQYRVQNELSNMNMAYPQMNRYSTFDQRFNRPPMFSWQGQQQYPNQFGPWGQQFHGQGFDAMGLGGNSFYNGAMNAFNPYGNQPLSTLASYGAFQNGWGGGLGGFTL